MESMTAIRLRLKKRNKILFQMQRERQHPELSFENMRSYNTVIPSGGRGNTVKSLDEIIEKTAEGVPPNKKEMKEGSVRTRVSLSRRPSQLLRPPKSPKAKPADGVTRSSITSTGPWKAAWVPLEPRGRSPNARTAYGVRSPLERPPPPREKAPDRDTVNL